MRTSILIFFGAFLAMMAFDYLYLYLPKAEFKAMGVEHPQVKAALNHLDHPVDATTGTVEERRFSVGYVMRATVMPGIRLIHDPSLGKEIMVKGPGTALDVLSLNPKYGNLIAGFTRPVKLREHVEVRANLAAHGSDRMRIDLYEPEFRTALRPEFKTTGPLTFRFLELINFGKDNIEVDAENLVLWYPQTANNIRGSAGRIEICYADKADALIAIPHIKAGEIIRTDLERKMRASPPPADPTDKIVTDSL